MLPALHTMAVQCSHDGGLININFSQRERSLLLRRITLCSFETLQGFTRLAPELIFVALLVLKPFLVRWISTIHFLRSSEISFVCAMIDIKTFNNCPLTKTGAHLNTRLSFHGLKTLTLILPAYPRDVYYFHSQICNIGIFLLNKIISSMFTFRVKWKSGDVLCHI